MTTAIPQSRFRIEPLEERIAPKKIHGGGATTDPAPTDSGTGTTTTSDPVADSSTTSDATYDYYDWNQTNPFDPNYYGSGGGADWGWGGWGW